MVSSPVSFRWLIRLFPVEDMPEVQLGGDDRAALGALVRPHDTLAFEGVYDTARSGVTDPEASLDRAYGGLLRGNHEARRLRQQVVLGLGGLLLFRLHLRHLIDVACLCTRGARGDDAVDLGLGDVGALNAGGA